MVGIWNSVPLSFNSRERLSMSTPIPDCDGILCSGECCREVPEIRVFFEDTLLLVDLRGSQEGHHHSYPC